MPKIQPERVEAPPGTSWPLPLRVGDVYVGTAAGATEWLVRDVFGDPSTFTLWCSIHRVDSDLAWSERLHVIEDHVLRGAVRIMSREVGQARDGERPVALPSAAREKSDLSARDIVVFTAGRLLGLASRVRKYAAMSSPGPNWSQIADELSEMSNEMMAFARTHGGE